MNLTQNLIESYLSLSANKLRSMLTVLGIVIGVAAVIAMLSIGKGATASITAQIESFGTNLIYVSPGSIREGGVASAQGTAGTLTMEDANALAQITGVVAASPEVDGFAQIAYLSQNTNSRLIGTTPSYLAAHNLTMADGAFIADSNLVSRSSVVVLGNGVAITLFGSTGGIVGQSVRMNGQPYRVIGVLTARGGTGFMNQDDQVFVPLTTAQSKLVGGGRFRGSNTINQITVQATSAGAVTQMVTEVTNMMRERHKTMVGTDDFSVSSQQDTLNAATQVTDTLTLFLGSIAGISLAVGGIGIMNIMLTSVSERTREIGLRKALGARRRDILTQFLVESMVLSVMGGFIGIVLGWLISRLIGQVQVGGSSITPVVGMDSVLLATLFSISVGLFFGIYPATRASRLLPVEALRYE